MQGRPGVKTFDTETREDAEGRGSLRGGTVVEFGVMFPEAGL